MQEQTRQLAVTSLECNWNAVTLCNAVYDEALAKFTMQLQYAGARMYCYDLPGKGILLVSWKKPDAQVS